MRLSIPAVLATGLLILSACGRNPPTDERVPPEITRFEVDRTRVHAGEAATLSWRVAHARSVQLVDASGTPLEVDGEAFEGTMVVTPLATSFYVLTATGDGGRDVAFLQVAVDEDLQALFLLAVPPVVDAGETVQLLWSAPGARSAVIASTTGLKLPLTAAAGAGVVEVTPDRTVGFTLVASGIDVDETRTATAEVKVRPVIEALTLEPEAALPGEPVRFTWKTAGASALSITEETWGALHAIEGVDEGTFEWTIPATLPNGEDTVDGMPLRFTVEVAQVDPAVTLTRTFSGHVGEGPVIEAFLAPAAVTVGKPALLEWRTKNATSVKVFRNGLPIMQSPSAQKGRYTVSDLQVDTTFELVATDSLGASTSARRVVRVVAAPKIHTFTLSPEVDAAGDPATATWTTQDAITVVLRAKRGASLYVSANPATVASGSTFVHPGLRTTVELVALNAAGDVDVREATVDVQAPGTLVATPSPVTRGDTVSVNWTVDPTVTAQLVGDPLQPELRTQPAQSLLDLRGHPEALPIDFDDRDEGVVELTFPAGFAFPFLGTINPRAWVSTNGFISFGAHAPGGANLPLDSGALPPMIAPFWDDLSLVAGGEVLYLLEGSAFPRRLILQWDEARTDAGGTLTFQLQLLETGEFRFVYAALSGTDVSVEGARIGWRFDATRAKELAQSASVVGPDEELAFFSAGSTSGAYTVTPERRGAFTLYGRLGSGGWVLYSAPVSVIAPGSVRVNEAMVVPAPGVPAGQWVELHNAAEEVVDLGGTVLSSTSTGTAFTLPAGVELEPGGYLVLGASTSQLLNGEAPVELAWSGFTPNDQADDVLRLSASSPLDALEWSHADLAEGESIQPPEDAIDWTGLPLRCPRTKTFGTSHAIGTPGAPNERCYPYVLQEIPVHYVDISVGNAPVSTTASRYLLDLGAAPFPYYGQLLTELTVLRDGYFTGVDPSPVFTSSNKWKPSTSSPYGTIAPYWDYLYPNSSHPGAGVYAKRLTPGADPQAPGGHWIIQYHHMRGNVGGDDMNLQAKLFDDGTIEFHYAAMISGSAAENASGRDATTWIESPAGDSALPVGINATYLKSNSAWRFSPVTPGAP